MQTTTRFPVRRVVLASLAGGLAEILWVALYASMTPLDASRVAHEVAASFVALPIGTGSTALGIGVHLLLSIAVAGAFAVLLWQPLARHRSPAATWLLAAAALAAVWAFNFGVLLPFVNPAFPTLMPHGVTLASKLLFGMSMAAVLDAGKPTASAKPGDKGGRLSAGLAPGAAAHD